MRTKSNILHETLLHYDIEQRNVLPVNEDVYASLTNYLIKEDIKRTAQPNLIVGESGSGKTFLLKRLYCVIERDTADALYPIIIEGKSLYSTNDIWMRCALSLNIDMEREDDCYDNILKWQDYNSKRIVMFIDNIQYYFNRTDDTEHYVLRGKLNMAGAPVLVASSETVLPSFTEYDAAFFDGFKITYLKPLTVSDIADMTEGRYDIARLETIMPYMAKTIRSMFIAVEILEKAGHNPEKDLDFLLDYFYLHYQARFDAVTTPAQRVLAALATTVSGLTLAEIRDITGQENSKISPYLKLMADQKIIKKKAKTLRGGIYSITDPLFRLWLRQI